MGIQVSEFAYLGSMIDAVDGMFEDFPLVLSITAGVLFLILAFAFRSIVAPLRLIIENLLVQCFYFGVNILIFQYGHVNGNDALFWSCIFIMITISIGLGCDYDVFGFNGAYRMFYDNLEQARSNGAKVTVFDCIIAAGDNLLVVMTAGLIMVVSFSGLLFSGLDMLLQFGSCLVFDLIFNCFFVVPVIVPSITLLFGEASFYPGNKIAKKKYSGSIEVVSPEKKTL